MPIPTQDTSSGVGSAIPASQLGSSVSYSLSGPAVTPCSTCCIECGRPSSTSVLPSTTIVNATLPTITSMPSGTASSQAYATGTGNATITPPISVGAGARVDSVLPVVPSIITVALLLAVYVILQSDVI